MKLKQDIDWKASGFNISSLTKELKGLEFVRDNGETVPFTTFSGTQLLRASLCVLTDMIQFLNTQAEENKPEILKATAAYLAARAALMKEAAINLELTLTYVEETVLRREGNRVQELASLLKISNSDRLLPDLIESLANPWMEKYITDFSFLYMSARALPHIEADIRSTFEPAINLLNQTGLSATTGDTSMLGMLLNPAGMINRNVH